MQGYMIKIRFYTPGKALHKIYVTLRILTLAVVLVCGHGMRKIDLDRALHTFPRFILLKAISNLSVQK